MAARVSAGSSCRAKKGRPGVCTHPSTAVPSPATQQVTTRLECDIVGQKSRDQTKTHKTHRSERCSRHRACIHDTAAVQITSHSCNGKGPTHLQRRGAGRDGRPRPQPGRPPAALPSAEPPAGCGLRTGGMPAHARAMSGGVSTCPKEKDEIITNYIFLINIFKRI